MVCHYYCLMLLLNIATWRYNGLVVCAFFYRICSVRVLALKCTCISFHSLRGMIAFEIIFFRKEIKSLWERQQDAVLVPALEHFNPLLTWLMTRLNTIASYTYHPTKYLVRSFMINVCCAGAVCNSSVYFMPHNLFFKLLETSFFSNFD